MIHVMNFRIYSFLGLLNKYVEVKYAFFVNHLMSLRYFSHWFTFRFDRFLILDAEISRIHQLLTLLKKILCFVYTLSVCSQAEQAAGRLSSSMLFTNTTIVNRDWYRTQCVVKMDFAVGQEGDTSIYWLCHFSVTFTKYFSQIFIVCKLQWK